MNTASLISTLVVIVGALGTAIGYLQQSSTTPPTWASYLTVAGGLCTTLGVVLKQIATHSAVTNVQAVQAITHPAAVAQANADAGGPLPPAKPPAS